jgi:membrane-bound lytic murein transglycosylase A
MLRSNPRVVFFREEPLTQPDQGPVGAQGIPLTPGRSIAVDRDAVPYGTPVWLDSTEPQPWSATAAPARPLQRLVVAQDTGGAIVGAVRADYFWGWGDEALTQAGRTKQPLRVWALWPRDTASTPSDPARILGMGDERPAVK